MEPAARPVEEALPEESPMGSKRMESSSLMQESASITEEEETNSVSLNTIQKLEHQRERNNQKRRVTSEPS